MVKGCREVRVGVLFLSLLVLFPAAGYSGPPAVGERVSPERLRGTIELFSSFQSRVPGSPGSRRAGDFIIERLKGLGLEAVAEQTFSIMAPVDRGSRLSLEESSSVADVYGFWPNLVRLPTTPGGGTRGPLLYAGTGRFSDFNDVPSDLWDQAIVLMDFDCSMRWLNAAMMGAAAVGFIEDTSAPRRQAVDKCLKVPLDLPRFLIRRGELAEFLARSGRPDLAGATAENLEEVLPLLNGLKVPGRKAFRKPLSAHLEIDMGWEEVQCRNITARLPGRDPVLRAEEVILQAHYDSISCTPKLAPGAENACGAAALLEMARVFKEARPRRSCVFLFTDAHFQALAGMRHYVYELYREEQARLAKAGLIASARERQERSTLLISLDLASHSTEVGLFFKGHFYDQQAIAGEERFTSKFIDIANVFDEQLERLGSRQGPGGAPERGAFPWGIEFANTIRAKKGLDWRTFVPERIALDSEVYSLDTRPGIALCTTRDARTWVDTPWDTPYVEGPEGRRERVDFARLSRQVKFLAELLGRCLSGEALPAYRLGSATALSFVYSDTFCKVVEDTLLSYLPTTSVDDALIACELNTAFSMRGVRGTAYLRSGADGRFLVRGLPSGQNRRMWSFRIDPEDGRITFVSNTAQGEGSWQAVVKGEAKDRPEPWLKRPTDRRFSVFQCVPLAVFDLIDQLSFRPLTTLSVLEARSNGPPRNHTVFIGDGPATVVFTKRTEPVKLLLSSARLSGRRMALLNSTSSKPEGEGFSFKETGGIIRWTALQAARDMWQLNEERIRRLERYGIKNARVRELHRWSEEARLEAEQELAEACLSDFRAHLEAGEEPRIRYDYVIDRSRTAWALEAKAYPEVRSTTNDVVKGLIFYFALLLPFTFFAERLFFSENERVPRWIMWVLLAGELAWLIPAWLVEWAGAGEGLDPVTRAVSGTVVAAVVAVSALILEKTLFRYRDIRAQLGHMGLIFTVVYLVLVLVHPAFKISKTPSVILIGFFMLMLAVIVIGLLLSRFGQQLRAARESANLAHREDVSRGGAAVVAFTLGVQNMRKRPIRTLLTSLTLILLMFTILSFVTFQQQTMYSVNAVGKRPAYEGLLIRYADWGSMQRYAGYTVVDYFKNMGTTATRSWLVSEDPKRALHIAIESVIEKPNEKPNEGPNPGPPRTYSVAGILGLEGAEAEVSGIRKVVASAGNPFAEGEWDGRDVCLLPERAAEHLGSPDGAPAGHVRIFGRKFRVVGVVREGQLTDLKDLDGEGVTPVDYVRTAERRAQQQQQQQQQITELGERARRAQIIQQFDHLAQERVVVMPRDVAERYGAAPRSIAFAPREPGELEKIVRNYANRSGLILFAGIGQDRFLYSTFGWLSVRGLTNLAVPFAIAALMVFNVMIGSVYERTREINIFASVGLAPLHIGSLFLAESAVYASMGAIFGYLLGQVVAKVTTTTDLFAGMTVNYSSTSAVVATAFVGGVVLLSTVFPAKKAADMSVPDETRKITLPKPAGDIWEFEFPFTVSTADALGLNVFLHDYFSSQDEDSTGRFSASEVSLERLEGEGHFRLSAKTWLMPLDMGISQSISFETRPTGYEESISEFFVRIERLSGEVAAWRRMNMGFFVVVRKQFLIWRLVKSDSKAEYRARGESVLGLAPGEAPAAAPEAEKAAPEAEPEKKEAEEAPAKRKPLPVALAVAAFLAAAALEFGLWGYSGLWGTVNGLPQAVVAPLVGLVVGTLSVGLLKDRAFACAWAGKAAWAGLAVSLLLGAVFLIMAMAPGLGELAPGETIGLYMGRRIGQAALQALRAAFFVGAAFALSRTGAREFLRSRLEPEAAK